MKGARKNSYLIPFLGSKGCLCGRDQRCYDRLSILARFCHAAIGGWRDVMSRVCRLGGAETLVEDLACVVPEKAEKIPNDRSRVPDDRRGYERIYL